jgi:hypothetical protein
MRPAPPPAPGTCDVENRPLYCEPWLWAAAGGAVLAGAGIAVYFVAIRQSPPPASTIELHVTGPDPSTNGLSFGR